MALIIKNASEVLTMTDGIGLRKSATIIVEDGIIKGVGDANKIKGDVIDASGCVITPGLVDAHSHLVFAGTREDEFVMKIEGIKYEQIAKMGGGILNTVQKTRMASEAELYELGMERINRLIKHGTTTLEIKSGYGLSCDEELKILRVINRLKQTAPIDIVPTLLIHTVPPQMKRRDYIDMVIEEMIPDVFEKRLAYFCDIFCDRTAFARNESKKILKKAKELGFKLKLHGDELSNSGGASLAAELGCISCDHLIWTTRAGINKLKEANVIPVLLPGTSLYLRQMHKPDIRYFMKKRLPLAIATDFNPGTCPIYSMPKIISLASLIYGLPPDWAFLGATFNAARALDLTDKVGVIKPGAVADFVIWKVDNYKKIPYFFGEDIVRTVIKKGKVIYDTNC